MINRGKHFTLLRTWEGNEFEEENASAFLGAVNIDLMFDEI